MMLAARTLVFMDTPAAGLNWEWSGVVAVVFLRIQAVRPHGVARAADTGHTTVTYADSRVLCRSSDAGILLWRIQSGKTGLALARVPLSAFMPFSLLVTP